MMDFLKSFKSLIKLGQIRTDNNVFRLHYKLTVIMLIVFSLLLTSKQFFGEPIQCMAEAETKKVIETYCWIYGTYTLQSTLGDGGHRSPIYGLGPYKHSQPPYSKHIAHSKSEDIIWHQYYQWVCLVFCFQALIFYVPRYLWKSWEGGQLRVLVNDFTGPGGHPNWNQTARSEIIRTLVNRKNMHNLYAFRYTLCEILNTLNVILQFFFINWLLNGRFILYGYKILFVSPDETNQMLEVFPKLTKCDFYKFGHSGSLENRDAYCVLSLNVLNEKLFLVLWFWLVTLMAISALALIYRVFIIAMPVMRIYLLMAQDRCLTKKQASLIISKLSYGDFFLLYHIGKNVSPVVFRDVITGLQETFKTKGYGFYPSFEAHSI